MYSSMTATSQRHESFFHKSLLFMREELFRVKHHVYFHPAVRDTRALVSCRGKPQAKKKRRKAFTGEWLVVACVFSPPSLIRQGLAKPQTKKCFTRWMMEQECAGVVAPKVMWRTRCSCIDEANPIRPAWVTHGRARQRWSIAGVVPAGLGWVSVHVPGGARSSRVLSVPLPSERSVSGGEEDTRPA